MGPVVMAFKKESAPPDASLFPPDSNLLVRAPPVPAATLRNGARDGVVELHGGLGQPTEFETDLWSGKMQVVFKVPEEQQAPEVTELLAGKKRQMWVMIQGRLKRPVSLEDLEYGSWFSRPLRFPAPMIVGPALHWLSARLGSTLHMQLRGDHPHVIGPLCAAVQTLNVSMAGEEPDMVAAQEDTRLLFGPGSMQQEPMPSSKRRAYFRRAAHRAGKAFSPEHVITLHCFDHSFNYNTFRMAVPPCFRLDMVKTLDAQPVDISLLDRSTNEWVLRFEVWHKRMLEQQACDADGDARDQRRRGGRTRRRRRGDGEGGCGEEEEEDDDGDDVMDSSSCPATSAETPSERSSGGQEKVRLGDVLAITAAARRRDALVAHAILVSEGEEEESDEELHLERGGGGVGSSGGGLEGADRAAAAAAAAGEAVRGSAQARDGEEDDDLLRDIGELVQRMQDEEVGGDGADADPFEERPRAAQSSGVASVDSSMSAGSTTGSAATTSGCGIHG